MEKNWIHQLLLEEFNFLMALNLQGFFMKAKKVKLVVKSDVKSGPDILIRRH